MKLSINTLDRNTTGDVVTVIHWSASKTSGDHTASTYGTVSLPEKSPSDSDFVSYSNITEEVALDWLRSTLGQDQLAAIEAALDSQLAELAAPKTASGLPWSMAAATSAE